MPLGAARARLRRERGSLRGTVRARVPRWVQFGSGRGSEHRSVARQAVKTKASSLINQNRQQFIAGLSRSSANQARLLVVCGSELSCSERFHGPNRGCATASIRGTCTRSQPINTCTCHVGCKQHQAYACRGWAKMLRCAVLVLLALQVQVHARISGCLGCYRSLAKVDTPQVSRASCCPKFSVSPCLRTSNPYHTSAPTGAGCC